MSSPNKPDVEAVSVFVSQLIVQMMDGNGLNLPMMKLPGVISAGKRLQKDDGKQVMVEILRKVEAAHPELWDLLLVGASEMVKERIRQALSPRKDIDITPEKA